MMKLRSHHFRLIGIVSIGLISTALMLSGCSENKLLPKLSTQESSQIKETSRRGFLAGLAGCVFLAGAGLPRDARAEPVPTNESEEKSISDSWGEQFPCPFTFRTVSAQIPSFINRALLEVNPAELNLEERFGVVTEKQNGMIYLVSKNRGRLISELKQFGRLAVDESEISQDALGRFRVSIDNLIPERARSIWGYQTILNGPNCYGTGLYTAGISNSPRFIGNAEVSYLFKNSGQCKKLQKAADIRKGDIVLFWRKTHSSSRAGAFWSEATPWHAAYSITDGGHWFVSKTSPRSNTRLGVFSDEALYEQIYPTNPECRFPMNEPDVTSCRIADKSADGERHVAWTEAYRCEDKPLPTRTEMLEGQKSIELGLKFDRLDAYLFAFGQGELSLSAEDLKLIQNELYGMGGFYSSKEGEYSAKDKEILNARYDTVSSVLSMSSPYSNGYFDTIEEPLAIAVQGNSATVTVSGPGITEHDLKNLWGEYRLDQSLDWNAVKLQSDKTFMVELTELSQGAHSIQVRFRNSTGGGSPASRWNTFTVP